MQRLRAAHYGVTCLDGQGAAGPVTVVLTIIPRKELAGVGAIIKGFDAGCFYSVDDVQSAEAGVFPASAGGLRNVVPGPLRDSAQLPIALVRPPRVRTGPLVRAAPRPAGVNDRGIPPARKT